MAPEASKDPKNHPRVIIPERIGRAGIGEMAKQLSRHGR